MRGEDWAISKRGREMAGVGMAPERVLIIFSTAANVLHVYCVTTKCQKLGDFCTACKKCAFSLKLTTFPPYDLAARMRKVS